MPPPIFGIAFVLATVVLFLSVRLVIDGPRELRTQAPAAIGIAAIMLVVIFGIGALIEAIPGGLGEAIVVALWAVVVVWTFRRQRRQRAALTDAQRLTLQHPAIRWLLGAYVLTLAILFVVAVIVTPEAP